MSIHPEEELVVELALMDKNEIITVLPFSKYASPVFAQKNNPKKNYVNFWI